MSYTIYTVAHCPDEMLNKHCAPALYAEGKLYLFGESLQEVAGVEPAYMVDIEAMGFNYPYFDGNAGLTELELNDYVTYLLSILGPGEVKLSTAQGEYLYKTRFKQKTEDL